MRKFNVDNIVNEIRNKSALKMNLDSYQEAWNLRSLINMRLRTETIKEYFSSSIVGTILVYWRIDKYGNRAGKTIAYTEAEEYISEDMVTKSLKDEFRIDDNEPWVEPDNKELLEQLANDIKAKKKLNDESRLNELLNKLWNI